jgi:hypothetical protein
MLLAIKGIFLELWRGREDRWRTKRSLDSLESVLRERNIEMEGGREKNIKTFICVGGRGQCNKNALQFGGKRRAFALLKLRMFLQTPNSPFPPNFQFEQCVLNVPE